MCVFEHVLLNADKFSWKSVYDGGNDFLGCLLKLIADENVCPVYNIPCRLLS